MRSYIYVPGFTLTHNSTFAKPIPEIFRKVFIYDLLVFLGFLILKMG